jgi:hypothetical protein
MGWLTDEVLYYGGMIVAGSSLLMMIIYSFMAKVRSVTLNAQLNTEYGERVK